jgi:hypothetical protein
MPARRPADSKSHGVVSMLPPTRRPGDGRLEHRERRDPIGTHGCSHQPDHAREARVRVEQPVHEHDHGRVGIIGRMFDDVDQFVVCPSATA